MLRSVTLGSLLAAAAASDPCECLNWKEVYETKRALCGEGQEFMLEKMSYHDAYWATSILPKTTELCGTFNAMNNNLCFNWESASLYGSATGDKQWCYVDSKCTKLNGGRKVPDSETIVEWIPKPLIGLMGKVYGPALYNYVNSNLHTPQPLKRDVSVKVCSAGDRLSRNVEPDILMDIGKAGGAYLEYLTRMAYNVVRDPRNHHEMHPIWQDVRTHIGKGGDVGKLPKKVAEAIKANAPIVVDTDSSGHHDHSQRIIKGSKVYKLNAQCPDNSCHGKNHGPTPPLTYSTPKGHDIGEL